MQKLHMVGFTTDHRGLIFSIRRGAKSGGYVVNVDAAIIEAVDELKALLAVEADANLAHCRAAIPREFWEELKHEGLIDVGAPVPAADSGSKA